MRVLFSVIAFRRVLLYDNVYGITLFAYLQAAAPKSPQNPFRAPAAASLFPLSNALSPRLFLFSYPVCPARRACRHNPKLATPVFKNFKIRQAQNSSELDKTIRARASCFVENTLNR
jgi:hypothetical protein